MSRTATSGLMRSIWLTASRPVRSDATTSMSASAFTQREISPRMTTESSTTMTRSFASRADRAEELANPTLIHHQLPPNDMTQNTTTPRAGKPPGKRDGSDQADFLELGRDD